jgi:hypothetical protein
LSNKGYTIAFLCKFEIPKRNLLKQGSSKDDRQSLILYSNILRLLGLIN